MHFSLDNPESVRYQAAASAYGVAGEYNTIIVEESTTSPIQYGYNCINVNSERFERMKLTSFNPSAVGIVDLTLLGSSASPLETGISHVYAKTASKISYICNATIPLPILHSFFEQLGVVRGDLLKIIIRCNTGYCTVVNTSTAYTSCVPSFTSASCCPFQLSPIKQGLEPGTVTGFKASLYMGHGSVSTSRTARPSLYLCSIQYNPMYDEIFNKTQYREVKFMDYYYSTSEGSIVSLETKTFLINSNVSRPRKLVIIPYLASGDTTGNYSMRPAMSPFSSAPLTTAPYSKITNLQVAQSSVNMFDGVKNYTYESYVENLRPDLSSNGGHLASAVSSGLITKQMFDTCYSYYVIDLSLKEGINDDNISRSISATFTNSSLKTCEYVFLLYHEKTFFVNPATGAIVPASQ